MELKDFCHDIVTRFDLTKPFKVGNKIVATTGHIIAWKEDDNTIDVKNLSTRVPPLSEEWIVDFNPTEDIPPVEIKIEKCTTCVDGIVTNVEPKCKICHGSGSVECGECEQDKDCEDCNGTGISEDSEYQCKDCDRNGNVDLSLPVNIFGFKYKPSIVAKLREAGAKVQLLNHISAHPNLLGFKVNNLTGFLLPMTVT